MRSYCSVVVKDIEYEVNGEKKTYETVCQVKLTKGSMHDQLNHYSIEDYDLNLLEKIYKDGVFYETPAEVPA